MPSPDDPFLRFTPGDRAVLAAQLARDLETELHRGSGTPPQNLRAPVKALFNALGVRVIDTPDIQLTATNFATAYGYAMRLAIGLEQGGRWATRLHEYVQGLARHFAMEILDEGHDEFNAIRKAIEDRA
ncbi:hypothetical protein [Roseisolibacter agri]|uniref:Uncharacterized protein n=1 Tax=Roseisolibacter agri TaxID=2014610 RepID=A0AA37V0S7_9BACT|nr:hypothetical protein [Roseisolibacter agri]GLC25075.1 hypothetical protein rosag_15880 [Roseisolibacter agri]